jgi:hypothetical protein
MECLRGAGGSRGEKGWSVGVEEGRSRGEGKQKDSQMGVQHTASRDSRYRKGIRLLLKGGDGKVAEPYGSL